MQTETVNQVVVWVSVISTVVTIVLGLIGIATLLVKYGRAQGRQDSFERVTNARLSKLEGAETHAITREELESKFETIRAENNTLQVKIDSVMAQVSTLSSFVKEAITR